MRRALLLLLLRYSYGSSSCRRSSRTVVTISVLATTTESSNASFSYLRASATVPISTPEDCFARGSEFFARRRALVHVAVFPQANSTVLELSAAYSPESFRWYVILLYNRLALIAYRRYF